MASENPSQGGTQDLMEKIVSLAKRRGFIYPSSEIYGGINGFWDYGPLGVELKRNLKDAWWQDIVRCPPKGPDGLPVEMVGLDCSIIMNPKVWEASGHVAGFADPMIDDRETKQRFRADQLYGVFPLPDPDIPDFARIVAPFILIRMPDGTPRIKACGVVVAANLSEVISQLQNDPASLIIDKSVWGKLRKVERYKPEVQATFEDYVNLEFRLSGNTLKMHALISPVPKQYLEQFASFLPSPATGKTGTLTEPRQFNLMFKTNVGAMEDASSIAYLRPETAQGIFANYKNVLDTSRVGVPFGIAQIGKAFRNEINPRNFTFRSREFEQMEIEFFCHPGEADRWYTFWRDARYQWYVRHGLKSSKLHLRDHEKSELAHYARACADVEYDFPFGTSELEGIANRTDFDLKAHQEKAGRDMTYFNDETKERFVPYVIEPSGGCDRGALAFLCEAFDEDEAPDEKGAMQKRTVLRFHPRLAPIKVAVFPLVKKDGLPEKAQALLDTLRPHMTTFYDEKGAVGRRYRRQDEAGTPFCVTVDGQTNEDGTVTIRDRDSMKQSRIPSAEVLPYVRERLS
jgi:glycyl-tRNA synthetase